MKKWMADFDKARRTQRKEKGTIMKWDDEIFKTVAL